MLVDEEHKPSFTSRFSTNRPRIFIRKEAPDYVIATVYWRGSTDVPSSYLICTIGMEEFGDDKILK